MKKTTSHLFLKLLLLLVVLLPSVVFAQGNIVQGTVLDANNEAVAGASVVVKGTNKSTMADADGKFSIEATSGDVLQISFVGLTTQEITVTDEANYNVTLASDTEQLDEVVVVGYGQRKRSNVTGAIVSVSSKELKSRPVNNALEAIQGKAAGVDITSSQRPGTLGAITIRGTRSLSASNTPLYVVDGIPLISGGIENINPLDIESIDILKDASSTAIYGSRGANGVVMVTTKKGKAGKFTISLNYSTTIEKIHDLAPMMNASDYITFRRWARYYQDPTVYPRGDQPNYDNDYAIFLGSQDPSAWANIERGWEGGTWDGSKVVSRDWTDYVTQTGITNQYSLNVGGGTEKARAFGSFGYLDNKGTVVGQQFKRYTGKVTVDINPTDWFSFGATLNASYSLINFGQSTAGRSGLVNTNGLYESAKAVYSYAVPYDENGERILFPGGDDAVRSVIDETKYSKDDRVNSRIFGSFYGQVNFGGIWSALDGLKYRVNFGPDLSFNRNGMYLDGESVIRSGSSYASVYRDQVMSYTLEHLLFYNKQLGKSNLDFVFGQTETKYRAESNSLAANNIPYSDQLWDALNSANVTLASWGASLTENQLLSYLGKASYTYDDKYSLTVAGRYDGASQLAEGNKWSFFPSAQAHWVMSSEDFLSEATWLNQLKLRVGAGVVGNSAISNYATKGGLTSIFYPDGSALTAGTAPATLANQDLTWEKTTQYNLGVDFSVLNSRINGALDVYTSKTTDLLMLQQINPVNGYPDTWANVGATKSNGIELSLNTVNIDTGKFMWTSTFNGQLQKNEITELANGVEENLTNNWFVGQSLGVIYGYESAGIWKPEDAEEMALFNANGHTFEAGQTRPADLNGDYKIDANNDRKVIGSTMPKYVVGLTNSFKLGNFDLDIFLYGRLGYKYSTGGEWQGGRFNQRQINYYTETNTNSDWQRPEFTAGTADPYFESLGYKDGSFIKIRNISLGYTFPKTVTDRLKISGLRIYVQAQNVGTIYSKVDWVDLDVNAQYFNRAFVTGINFDL
ncbi:SusC/RagA family TonB-linked outer membrane protein [Flavobacterium akiainvivens]|uniref:SusC/RagA family TonB-linked outer membrane protein n=1 Tax=Flavobacterium akiainvivens TaxID=1202724 RepID=UPI0006C89E95|nr:TonB-dependent receptor [Flavobacterium akiainvivens]SFQ35929.1 TonB-linked outer membrane protein, SusC/RagA family [Flavobacterium akiainvivens]